VLRQQFIVKINLHMFMFLTLIFKLHYYTQVHA